MPPAQKICVYCGSGPGRNPAYVEAARTLGKALAKAEIGLVYGGGSLGLMGEVARAVLAEGGHVTGVIPSFLADRERLLDEASEVIVTADMHERKMTMFARSTGFVALPGGMGTLEELSEIATWAQLGQHAKPIVLCNVEGYWNPLITLIAHMREEKFIRDGIDVHFETVNAAEDVIPAYEQRLRSPQGRKSAAHLIHKL